MGKFGNKYEVYWNIIIYYHKCLPMKSVTISNPMAWLYTITQTSNLNIRSQVPRHISMTSEVFDEWSTLYILAGKGTIRGYQMRTLGSGHHRIHPK